MASGEVRGRGRRPGGRRSKGRRRDRGGPRFDLLGSKRHVARSPRLLRASHPGRARGAVESVRRHRLQRLRAVASGGRGRGGDGGDLLGPQPRNRRPLRPRPAPSGVVLASRLPLLRRQFSCGRRLRPRRFDGRSRHPRRRSRGRRWSYSLLLPGFADLVRHRVRVVPAVWDFARRPQYVVVGALVLGPPSGCSNELHHGSARRSGRSSVASCRATCRSGGDASMRRGFLIE